MNTEPTPQNADALWALVGELRYLSDRLQRAATAAVQALGLPPEDEVRDQREEERP